MVLYYWDKEVEGSDKPMYDLLKVRVNDILDIPQLSIPAGKITCIIGESGSGKTTLLRLLNGMISCDEGDILVDGGSITRLDLVELRRKAVMVPQTPAIFKGTVRDNLLIGLHFSEKPAASDEQLQEVLETVRLDKELDQEADALSGGEKQRLALARVLLMKPLVWLLDEPTSALDEDTSQSVMREITERAKQQGQTVVIVTHSKEVVRLFAENIVEIQKGRIAVKGGSPHELHY